MKRSLVTTALEETWPGFDVPILFLGEWCKIYNRRNIWERFDSKTFPYHWDDRDKLHKDYFKLQSLYEDVFLPSVSQNLNRIHNTNRSLEFWRILLGPWLGLFIQIVYDRFESVRILKESDDFILPQRFAYDEINIVSNGMMDFYHFLSNDYWNQWIFDSILDFFFQRDNSQYLFIQPRQAYYSRIFQRSKSFKEKCKDYLSKFCIRKNEAFIIGDYLPLKESVLLQLKLKQFPRKRRDNQTFEVFKFDKNIRNNWSIPQFSDDSFYSFIKSILPFQIPKVYIEGFENLKNITNSKEWPVNPKFIFTANSHVGNDPFKFWAAEEKEKGVPLILSQHGGYYGIGKISFLEDHEKKISNRYLTWGWHDEEFTNVVPNFSVKFAKKKDIYYNPKGNGLLVEHCMPRYSYWMQSVPVAGQILRYFDDQYLFIKHLSPKVKSKFVIKLYPQDYDWNQKERWENLYPTLIYDNGQKSLESLMKKSRICVTTYNATTYLESLGLNMPTLIFWDPNYWELRESALAYFQMLKDVGILFEDPVSASLYLNKIWDSIEDWWQEKERQRVREIFLEKYCRRVKNPLHILSVNLDVRKIN
ncbi:LIC12162 family protein [Leptospira santarosai]|uniref:Putative transferase, LIC12162 family n=1 Tax=Leptospira santarosai str. ZUN179 TaxID=1049985 RepID=M6UMD7_9LEPT|nr:LIC12162 family protein [Leptospira santarosai]EMO45745.1 putative transferase, LIC12162 family [Leptospira santarosai str. ZUN179]MDI7184852.1 LIC12162 family protein [Leptospira santarosai]UZN08560.1 LIC12162 family protein [Leptospira santarosai]